MKSINIAFTILALAFTTPAWADSALGVDPVVCWHHHGGDGHPQGTNQGNQTIPEIDPALATSAVVVIAGGVLVLGGLRRK